MQRKYQRNIFVLDIIASELVALSSLYEEENTCHRHSVCQETVLRFSMSLRETYCKSIAFTAISKYGKDYAMEI